MAGRCSNFERRYFAKWHLRVFPGAERCFGNTKITCKRPPILLIEALWAAPLDELLNVRGIAADQP